MLNFEEKKAIFDSFAELEAKQVSMGRLNYHFKDSAVDKTMVVKFLHPKSANAFVYAGYLPKEQTHDGYLSIYDADEAEIRERVAEGIAFLKKTVDGFEEDYTEKWLDDRKDELLLQYSKGVWLVILTTGSVEAVFKTKEAAEDYLIEEGFQRN